jgi:hypothetical protein
MASKKTYVTLGLPQKPAKMANDNLNDNPVTVYIVIGKSHYLDYREGCRHDKRSD